MKLFVVLATVKALLEAAGKEEGWSGESPQKSLKVINQAIAFFLDPEENEYPEGISVQFAPTGPLQEISIANGWDEVFLRLAAQYDLYEHCLKEKKAF